MKLPTFAGVALIPFCLFANNLSVTNVTLAAVGQGKAAISFDLSWEHSWRDVENHDAAWVFVKYSPDGGTRWAHASLAAAGLNPAGFSSGSGTAAEISVPSDRKGAFVRRATDGSGTFSATGVTLVWDFAADGVSPHIRPVIRVNGIEMVLIPRGSFTIGSTDANDSSGKGPFYVTFISSPDMTRGPNSGSGKVADPYYAVAGCGRQGNVTGTFPAGFPNGYEAFYCAKHELSESAYVAMLNTLTAQQAISCYCPGINGLNGTVTDFACSFGSDYPERAIRLTPPDKTAWRYAASFVDWAALRPITDLEYQKAMRGPLPPVLYEYAWGGATDPVFPTKNNITGAGTAEEMPPAEANANYGGGNGLNRPMRVGAFAREGTTREQAGAGYYGPLNLSDNLLDRAATSGDGNANAYDTAGPAFCFFDGTHGDGKLTVYGESDEPGWIPMVKGQNGLIYGYTSMGGCYEHLANNAKMLRADARHKWIYTYTSGGGGMRAARAAEDY
jgi:hypothetical protein